MQIDFFGKIVISELEYRQLDFFWILYEQLSFDWM